MQNRLSSTAKLTWWQVKIDYLAGVLHGVWQSGDTAQNQKSVYNTEYQQYTKPTKKQQKTAAKPPPGRRGRFRGGFPMSKKYHTRRFRGSGWYYFDMFFWDKYHVHWARKRKTSITECTTFSPQNHTDTTPHEHMTITSWTPDNHHFCIRLAAANTVEYRLRLTSLNIGCAWHSPSKFGSALACTMFRINN